MKRLALLLFLVIGCERPAISPELSPTYAAARQAVQRSDFIAAATAYWQLLDQYPQFERGHLELALLYDEKLGDPIEAIHHYRRCLALEPNSDKRRSLEAYIERARLALAAKLPGKGSDDAAELIRLQAQNNALLAEIAALKNPPPPVVVVLATNPVPPVVTNVVAEVPKPRTHKVQKGDTLYSLAVRYYGNRQEWVKIYDANKATVPNKDQLRIDQVLVIP